MLDQTKLSTMEYPYPRDHFLFSAEKYARHHTPDPSPSNLLNRIDLAEDHLRHLLYLSSLTREKAGPTPEMKTLRRISSLLFTWWR